jgi:hypothetical protein
MRTPSLLKLFVGLVALALSGCSGSGSSSSSVQQRCGAGVPFCLVSCDLGCDSAGHCALTQIAENQKLRFTFNIAVEPSTVNTTSFSLRTASGQSPDGEIQVNGATITFVPTVRQTAAGTTFGFSRNETYILTMAGGSTAAQGIRSIIGDTLKSEISCQLQATLGIIDEDGQPPVGDMVAPTDLLAAPVDSTIVVRFSELIDTTPFNGSVLTAPIIYQLRRVRSDQLNGTCGSGSSTTQAVVSSPTLALGGWNGATITFTGNVTPALAQVTRPITTNDGTHVNWTNPLDTVPASGDTFTLERLQCDTGGATIRLEGVPQVSVENVNNVNVTVISLRPSIQLPGRACVQVQITSDVHDLSGRSATPRNFQFFTTAAAVVDSNLTETFTNATHMDVLTSSGTWNNGARPGQIGGDGHHGSFDLSIGLPVGNNTFLWNTDSQVIPFDHTLDGNPETVTDGKFYFSDFTLPAGATLRFTGTQPAQIYVRGRAEVLGKIDLNAAAMTTFNSRSGTTGLVTGQPGGVGGAGGANGGHGGDRCAGAGPVIVNNVNTNDGQPGQDVRVPATHAYASRAVGTGGAPSLLYPSSGLTSSVTYTILSAFSGMVSRGGSGGGFWTPGGVGFVQTVPTGFVPSRVLGSTVVDSGTASAAGTTTTLIDSTKAWAVNGMTGNLLRMASGATSSQERLITSNTATVLTVSPAFTALTAASASYQILSARASGTSTAGTISSLDDTTQNWATNQFIGCILRMTSGSASGQERMINGNTATHMTVAGAFSNSAGTGSTYLVIGGPGSAFDPFLNAALGTLPASVTSTLDHFLIGGSGGGGGGSHPLEAQIGGTIDVFKAGAGGSGGGGAVGLRAGGDLNVRATGRLEAKGGTGFQFSDRQNAGLPAPGGGGSGGSCVLQAGGAITLEAGAAIDTSGGGGSNIGGVASTSFNVNNFAGPGAPGSYRIEALAATPDLTLATLVPTADPVRHTGTLTDSDARVGCESEWRGTGRIFPPEWLRYVLEVDINGDGTVDQVYTDDANYTLPAGSTAQLFGPADNNNTPVKLSFQGAQVSNSTGQPVGGTVGRWRSYINAATASAAGVASINSDDATGFRFTLIFNRGLFPTAVVKSLTVTVRG